MGVVSAGKHLRQLRGGLAYEPALGEIPEVRDYPDGLRAAAVNSMGSRKGSTIAGATGYGCKKGG